MLYMQQQLNSKIEKKMLNASRKVANFECIAFSKQTVCIDFQVSNYLSDINATFDTLGS